MTKSIHEWCHWPAWQAAIAGSPLAAHWNEIATVVETRFQNPSHGDVPGWLAALERLKAAMSDQDWSTAESALQALHPWRKGPIQIGPITIDTEWRSDWKWNRFLKSNVALRGRNVLDIGCGNGYYVQRALQAGAQSVLGIDPMWLYVMQWFAINLENARLHGVVLPLTLEEFPATPDCFDVVFSWGVLSHRRSPLDHLIDLQTRLTAGGVLVLETLVLRNAPGQVLVPRDRYAQMRNVWFIPDTEVLVGWLERLDYRDVRVVDVTATTCEEQRATRWMQFQSLAAGLDPNNPLRTIEGYPSPVRAMIIAKKEEA